jgi:hypothetical protein
VLAAVALMLADIVSERYGWHGPAAPVRLLTGLLLSYPVGSALAQQLLGRADPAQNAP